MSSAAIITGASQGIGRATAVRLAQDFSCVVLVARNLKNLNETASLISSNGRSSRCKLVILDLDFSNPAAADIIITCTLKEFGRIDALINISGAIPRIDLFEMTDEQRDSGQAVKRHGARRLTLQACEYLKVSHGSVVFILGSSALTPTTTYAAVGVANATIVALAEAFSDREIVDGVQVNSVLPGPVMTNRRRTGLEKWAPAHGMTVAEAVKKFPAEAGITRFGEPEEIAELMAFLVSLGARWMTGSALRMDGGEIKSV